MTNWSYRTLELYLALGIYSIYYVGIYSIYRCVYIEHIAMKLGNLENIANNPSLYWY